MIAKLFSALFFAFVGVGVGVIVGVVALLLLGDYVLVDYADALERSFDLGIWFQIVCMSVGGILGLITGWNLMLDGYDCVSVTGKNKTMTERNETTEQEPLVGVETIYKQQYAHFSNMNGILYKMPLAFAVIISWLWLFAVTRGDKFISVVVFFFATICCVGFCMMMNRFRGAFSAYINNLNTFDGKYQVSIKPVSITKLTDIFSYFSSIAIIQFLLLSAFFFSLMGIFYVMEMSLSFWWNLLPIKP